MNKGPGQLSVVIGQVLAVRSSFLYFSRAEASLDDAAMKLTASLEEIVGHKKTAMGLNSEDEANSWLSLEFLTVATFHEFKMVYLLKQGKPNEAWESLIDAQSSATDAYRSHPITAERFGELLDHLLEVESLWFPPMLFMSNVVITDPGTCSICKNDYSSNCTHIEGKPYNGALCKKMINEYKELKRIDIVKNPKTKKHRAKAVIEDGYVRDWISGAMTPSAEKITEYSENVVGKFIASFPIE